MLGVTPHYFHGTDATTKIMTMRRNPVAPGNGGITDLFHAGRPWVAVPE
jgi:hypothetical protein